MTTQPVLSSSVVMMKVMNNNLHHNDYIILYQLTLTLKMNTTQVVKTSVTVIITLTSWARGTLQCKKGEKMKKLDIISME